MIELLIIGLLYIGLLLVLYALGMPVAIAMGTTVIVVMLSPFGSGIEFGAIATRLLHGLNSFPLLAIPFYVLLGRLMNGMGLTQRIFRFANAIVGQFRGGIAYVNILASMIFSGMSGLAVADAAGLGRIEYQAMREYDYEKDIAIGVTGSSAIIGPLIPPSVAVIILAVLAGESISDFFLGGIIPGILMGLALTVFAFIMLRGRGYEPTHEFSTNELLASFKEAFAALLTPVIIIGGLLSGIFTATEAGAVAVVYVIIIGRFFYKDLTIHGIYVEMRDSMVETCALTLIVAVAAVYGLIAIQLGLPVMLTDAITGVTSNTTIILLLLVGVFLIVGTFMETIAAISVLVPVLAPVIDTAGIDPIHFGIVVLLALLLGLLTPPFGIILFVLDKVTDATLEEIMKAIIPYYIPIAVVLLLVIIFPELTTYVPYELAS